MTPRKIIILFLFCLPGYAFAQWPLGWISRHYYIYSVPDQHLLSKVKYTNDHHLAALFNWIINPPNDNFTIDGMSTTNYWNTSSGGMFIMVDSSGSNIRGNGGELRVWGSYSNYAKDFEPDNNGNYIVLGDNVGNNWDPVSPVNSNPTDSTQLLLYKLNPQNKVVWYKLYGGSSAEYAVSIKKAADGNFIIVAQTQSNDGDVKGYLGGKDIWMLKIDGNNGNIIWQKTLGSPRDEIPSDLEILADGSIMISGTAEQSSFAPSSFANMNSFLLKLDASGNFTWMKVFGGDGNDRIKSFIPTDDGGFASISASTSSNGDYPINAGSSDIYIFKHNASGDIVWKSHYGNSGDDEPGDIVYTPCDGKIFASYAKQFSNDTYYASNPPYPLFSQTAGVQVGLYNDGTQFYYFEDNFEYSTFFDDYFFNAEIYNTMAPNDRGGFLGGGFSHWRNGSVFGSSNQFLVRRTFHVEEYGVRLQKNSYDTLVCVGQAVWGITFNKDSTFSDTLRNGCHIDTLINKFTVKVTSIADSIISKDTTICYGQLFEGNPVTGSFTKKDTLFTVTNCGIKRIITNKNIFVPPVIGTFLGNDTTACKGGILLNATLGGASYLWQNGATSPTLLATDPALYWVQVTDSYGCTKRDSINMAVTDLSLTFFHDTTISYGQSVLLAPLTNGSITWQFSNSLSCQSCQSTVAKPGETETFYLSSSKDGCVVKASVMVKVLKEYFFYIPSAFTPNHDGINDVFRAIANRITDYDIKLYNRWGKLIFKTNDILEGWDGRLNGVIQPNGIYVYLVSYEDPNGKRYSLKGTFLLIQ